MRLRQGDLAHALHRTSQNKGEPRCLTSCTCHSHSVLPLLRHRVSTVDLEIDDNVQVTRVLFVGLAADDSLDIVLLLDRCHIAKVKDGLCKIGVSFTNVYRAI